MEFRRVHVRSRDGDEGVGFPLVSYESNAAIRTDEDYVQRYDCVLHPEASHLRRIEWEEHPALGWQFLAEHEALCLFFGRAGNLHIERVHLRAGLDGELYGFGRSEEHTSELQSLMRISYAVFCLKKKTKKDTDLLNQNA